jgi:hypothetical protein
MLNKWPAKWVPKRERKKSEMNDTWAQASQRFFYYLAKLAQHLPV